MSPLRFAALILALTAASGCAKKVEKQGAGGSCVSDYGCVEGRRCYERRCMTVNEAVAAEAKAKAAAEEAERLKEKRMLEASGVETTAATAEASDTAPGAAIRVVKVIEETSSLAACRSTERLVGGSCEGGDGGPESYSAADTIGARWRCASTNVGWKVTAYALCAKVD